MIAFHCLLLFLALLLDRLVGDPPKLWARVPHPVVIFGAAIGLLDRRLNRETDGNQRRKLLGTVAILLLLSASVLVGWLLHAFLMLLGWPGVLVEIIIVAIFLAQKSLGDHVGAVARGLRAGGLDGGRRAVALIVGRDPQALDTAGVCRAAIESLAENFADGVVAPAFWYAVGGLPGILAYKMLNTADSMIGHRTERHLQFGWASARLDDIANWPAARLSALLIAAGAYLREGRVSADGAVFVAMRDHGLHRSVNSGWPEAAMAGALDLQLAGPRRYRAERVSESMINAAGRAAADTTDIDRGLAIFETACTLITLGVAIAGLALLAL